MALPVATGTFERVLKMKCQFVLALNFEIKLACGLNEWNSDCSDRIL